MSAKGEDWDEVRGRWQRLADQPLAPEDVFDKPAQQRMGSSIAKEAVKSPQSVTKLKMSRRNEAYYLLQVGDAQDHAERAHSTADRDAWTRIANKWLELLRGLRGRDR